MTHYALIQELLASKHPSVFVHLRTTYNAIAMKMEKQYVNVKTHNMLMLKHTNCRLTDSVQLHNEE